MVNSDEFKKKIEALISQDYKVEFLGTNFDEIVNLLTESKANQMYKWLQGVVKHKIQPIVIGSKKQYKEWVVKDLLTFRYPFTIGLAEYRIMFVKVKNSIYVEFHLGDHKYYDKLRKELDLKKNS